MNAKQFILMALLALPTMFATAQPVVKTNPRYARGATMAFGRMTATANGTSITKRGFCWSTQPNPTVDDNYTTKTLSLSSNSGVSGTIYWLQNLEPATMYYMRAFVTASNGTSYYGEQIKFCTIPKGTIALEMRDGGDATVYNRIKQASEDAVNYWNELTEMKGFRASVGFVDGTPTADCSYGGWIRVGSNSSYQRTGTIMHEMLHGVGVIPWADTEWSRHTLRSGVNGDGYGTGYWLGDRVTEVVRFLQNSETAQLNGDYQHMWPFGINGASEDTGGKDLYIANGLVCQALGEDGLQHTSSLFAEPYYSFNQEDTIKYYLKNESADRGRLTSFLVPNASGVLKWRNMTSDEAAENDSAAWYITFTPENQYYQFRNAKTGQYISYSSGIKMMTRTTLTANDNWHLMKGRVDVDGQRGYWIIHPASTWTPQCLQANLNGATGATTFNIANSANVQRWLIQSMEQMRESEQLALKEMRQQTIDMLERAKQMLAVPHLENTEGTDLALNNVLNTIEPQVESSSSTTELSTMTTQIETAIGTFLRNVTATDPLQPFDLTYMLVNPTVDENCDGWSKEGTVNYGCVEFYQTTFDFNQTLKQLPAGTYQFCAQGFQRPGSATTSYSDYNSGNNKVTAQIYAGSKSTKLAHICDGMQNRKVGKGNETAVTTGKYVPNDMQASSAYFAKGLYENSIISSLAANNGSLKMGIKCTSMPSGYWVIFDNFRLYFYGKMAEDVLLGIETASVAAGNQQHNTLYTLDGRRVDGNAALRPGLYIKNGRKVVVK